MIKIETDSMSIHDIKISPNQDKLACALIEAPLKVFDITSGKEIISYKDSNYDSAWSIDWHKVKEEEFVLAGYGNSGYMRIIDLEGEDRLKYGRSSSDYGYPDAAQLHSDSVWKLRVLNDQSYSVSDDGSFTRLNLILNKDGFFTYSRKNEKRLSIYGSLYDICFFDQHYIIIAKNNLLIKLSQEKFSAKGLLFFNEHQDRVVSVCKLNDQKIISGSEDKTMKIWDIHDENSEQTIKLDSTPYCLMSSNDHIFHISKNKVIIRQKTDFSIIETIVFGTANLMTFDVSNDLKTIVAGDEDGVIYIIKPKKL